MLVLQALKQALQAYAAPVSLHPLPPDLRHCNRSRPLTDCRR